MAAFRNPNKKEMMMLNNLRLVSEETSTRSDTITHKIEKGIPIPAKEGRGRHKGELRLTMEQMEVGDSIVIEDKHRQQVHQVANAIGIGYTSRTISKEPKRVRVWRTK